MWLHQPYDSWSLVDKAMLREEDINVIGCNMILSKVDVGSSREIVQLHVNVTSMATEILGLLKGPSHT